MSAPRLRGLAFGALGVVALFVFTQLVLPGGVSGRGTPAAILFLGIVYGLLNGLVAAGVVLVYRSHRIINFAQAALGSVGGVFVYNFTVLAGWPFLLAFVAGVVVSGGVGLAVELAFVRRFFGAPRLVLTVVSGAIVFALVAASGFVNALPIFGDIGDRTQQELLGSAPVALPFQSVSFSVGNLPLDFGFAHVFAVVMSIAALFGLGAFLRFTKMGTAIRATAENAERAQLLGIGVGMVSSIVWMIAGVLGGLGVILTGTVQQQFGFAQVDFALLIVAFASAVIAQMRSIPVAVAAAVGLTILQEAVRFSFERQTGLKEAVVFALILGGLLLQRERLQRSEAREESSWQAAVEPRPIPKEMLGVGGIRAWRYVGAALLAAVVVVWPFAATPRQTQLTGYYMILAIVLLSLTVLTGWAGQVSWGQLAFVAIGAVLGGAMTSKWGIPFWIALVLAPVLTAGITMLVGLPALRIRGLFLGIVTFSFAFVVQLGLFNDRLFGWLLPTRIDRPTLFILDFEEERSMYFLVAASVVLTAFMVTTMRRSRIGRVLIALRDNEPNVQSFGVNAVRTRLAAFGLSGFICGFAGVLIAHHQRAATATMFPAEQSLFQFVIAIVGGVGSVTGAVVGAAYQGLLDLAGGNQIVRALGGPLLILAILYAAPGGIAGILQSLRDGVLRIIAQRRQMVVPSLFADYDPEDLERQLIPLAEPLSSGGLAALPIEQRYRTPSDLYGSRGRALAVRHRQAAQEAAAFGAAAESFAGDEDEPATDDTTRIAGRAQ